MVDRPLCYFVYRKGGMGTKMIKRITLLLTLILLILTVISITALAADRTSEVSASTSNITKYNTSISVYDAVNQDPDENLCTIKVKFLKINMAPVYQNRGDTVSFYIKTSGNEVTGWIDRDADGNYDSNETLNGTVDGGTASSTGLYIKDARLTKESAVSIKIGSTTPGAFTVQVYSAEGEYRGSMIDVPVTLEVKDQQSLSLIGYNRSTGSTLSGNTGALNDPYELKAGQRLELHAYVKNNGVAVVGKEVTFKKSFNGGVFETLGTEETYKDGKAVLDYEARTAGLYSFKAAIEGKESQELYIAYSAGDMYDIVAKTEDDMTVVEKEPFDIEFCLVDRYGNTIDTKGEKKVEISVIKAPAFSKYGGYNGDFATNSEGIAVFHLMPDRKGDYIVKAAIKGRNTSERLEFTVVDFGELSDIQLVLKSKGIIVPALRYTDANNDGIADIAGIMEAKLINSEGAGLIATGDRLTNLMFKSSDPANVTVNNMGQIRVLNREFTGEVTIEAIDLNSTVAKEYRLTVAGVPAYIKNTHSSDGKRVKVKLQYVDKNGNETYAEEGEEYNIVLSETGIVYSNVEKFDAAGQALFTLTAQEYKAYPVTIITKSLHIASDFQVFFYPEGQEPGSAAKRVVMFIGLKSYSQDGISKISEVAPFIKDGRTFVAVRPLAEAFGANIDWNAETQTVTLSRPDLTLKIMIGSNKIVKTANGITFSVNADVPAFITAEGRTVLPFRAIGEAFGVAVSYDAATQSVSYTQ